MQKNQQYTEQITKSLADVSSARLPSKCAKARLAFMTHPLSSRWLHLYFEFTNRNDWSGVERVFLNFAINWLGIRQSFTHCQPPNPH